MSIKGGFRPLNLENSILRYGLRGKARTRPDILGVVLGPCAQYCPCEASEQKMGPKTKVQTKGNRVNCLIWTTLVCFLINIIIKEKVQHFLIWNFHYSLLLCLGIVIPMKNFDLASKKLAISVFLWAGPN